MLDYLRRDGTRDLEIHPNEEPVRRAAADRGVRVLLSGWGGDEGVSFNGRGYDLELLRDGRLVTLWRLMRERSRHPAAAILVRVALPFVWPDGGRILRELRERRWPLRRRTLAHPAFARRAPPLSAPRLPCAGARNTQVRLIRTGQLAERMDGWAVGGARYGIEYGYPLLDRRLLEFALGLPPKQYRRGPTNRWLMRHALRNLLPAAVCRELDKRDPARFGAFESALDEALPAVGNILGARSEPPSRSAYLDMRRLRKELAAGSPRAGTRPGAILNAVRFLDF